MSIRSEAGVSVIVSGAELDLLKHFDFPCSDVLSTARQIGEGFRLTGSWADFDAMAGWVAGEANHARASQRTRETELLDSIADEIEDVLASQWR
jgi:hypothetical protein